MTDQKGTFCVFGLLVKLTKISPLLMSFSKIPSIIEVGLPFLYVCDICIHSWNVMYDYMWFQLPDPSFLIMASIF